MPSSTCVYPRVKTSTSHNHLRFKTHQAPLKKPALLNKIPHTGLRLLVLGHGHLPGPQSNSVSCLPFCHPLNLSDGLESFGSVSRRAGEMRQSSKSCSAKEIKLGCLWLKSRGAARGAYASRLKWATALTLGLQPQRPCTPITKKTWKHLNHPIPPPNTKKIISCVAHGANSPAGN